MAPRPRSSILKDSFRKRSRTVIHKAHELAARYGAQVYVVVQFNGKFQTYNSVEGEQWPPSTEKISKSFPLPVILTRSNYDVQSKPKSNSLSPKAEPQRQTTVVNDTERINALQARPNSAFPPMALDPCLAVE